MAAILGAQCPPRTYSSRSICRVRFSQVPSPRDLRLQLPRDTRILSIQSADVYFVYLYRSVDQYFTSSRNLHAFMAMSDELARQRRGHQRNTTVWKASANIHCIFQLIVQHVAKTARTRSGQVIPWAFVQHICGRQSVYPDIEAFLPRLSLYCLTQPST